MFEEEVFEISEKSLNLTAVLEFFENVELPNSDWEEIVKYLKKSDGFIL